MTQIIYCFLLVVKMEKIQEELKSLREGDNSRIKLHEKMADTAVDIGNYKQAITYYSKTVRNT